MTWTPQAPASATWTKRAGASATWTAGQRPVASPPLVWDEPKLLWDMGNAWDGTPVIWTQVE